MQTQVRIFRSQNAVIPLRKSGIRSAMPNHFTALVLDNDGEDLTVELKSLSDGDLPDGDVTVAVEYSTVNYKDGLIVDVSAPGPP